MKFSIVVPVYNTEPAYFHQCMESILGQDYRGRYEVILIDDGSTTDIGRICDEYGRRDPRVVVVHQENRGVSEARNQGICRASGEWLYFVDPDDWIQTDTLKSAAEQLEQHQLDILCVAYQEEYGQESISYGYGWSEYRDLGPEVIDTICLGLMDPSYCSLPCSFGSVCTQFYRADFLGKGHLMFPPDLRRMEDTMFNLQTLEAAPRMGVLDRVFYHYRQNPSSVCNRYNPGIQDHILAFNEALYRYIQGKPGEWKQAFEYKMTRNYCEILRLYYFNPGWTGARVQKLVQRNRLVKHTAYAQYLGKHSYRHIWKKSGRYGVILFLTYNLPSFFLLQCFWKAYNGTR